MAGNLDVAPEGLDPAILPHDEGGADGADGLLAKPCIGAEESLFTAIILPAPFIPTLCCIAPDIPNAMYSSGFTILPESPT